MSVPENPFAGRYRILDVLGEGGYATVYRADELVPPGSSNPWANEADEKAGQTGDTLRRVALKVFHRQANPRRFDAEIRALCRLNHPNVVTVFHHGRAPTPWLAMELVDGAPLTTLQGDPARADVVGTLQRMISVAEGLAHAHARGVVHRDLKPPNILVDARGQTRIIDFGLSWFLPQDATVTQRVGTPGFLAPELIEGDPDDCDHRTDLYSVGAILYTLFAGHGPFDAHGVFAIVRRQLAGEVDFPDTVPEPLRDLVRRCLASDPAERPRSAGHIAEELRRIAWKMAAHSMEGAARRHDHGERVDLRDATVRELETLVHPERGPCVRLRAVPADAPPDATPLGAFAWKDGSPADRRVHDALASLWEGAEVSLLGASVRHRDDSTFLLVDGATLPVIEPAFPISVTDVARVDGVRAAPCATRSLVALRDRRPREHYLVEGSLAHRILEHLMRAPAGEEPDFATAFDRAVAEQRLELLAAAFEDADLPELRDRMKAHFTFLAPWTARARAAGVRAAEARRLSGRYGLEGRIDLALLEEGRMHIVELKTGRRQTTEHEQQLRCYALLWDEAAQTLDRQLEGTLLYSQIGAEKPLYRGDLRDERRVVLARNDLVALHRHFSDGDAPVRPLSWMQQPDRCRDEPCRWLREDCRFQTSVLGAQCGARQDVVPPDLAWGDTPRPLIDAARRWYFHFVRLVEREYRAASLDVGRLLRPDALPERLANQDAFAGAVLASADPAAGTVRFTVPPQTHLHEGDRIVAHRGDLDAQPALHGIVRQSASPDLVLVTDGAGLADALPADGWFLEREPARIGFRDMHLALWRALIGPRRELLELLVNPAACIHPNPRERLDGDADDAPETAPPDNDSEPMGSSAEAPDHPAHDGPIDLPSGTVPLNPRQQAAVERALSTPHGLLIQGPPGTGKTTVIAEIVRRLVADGQRVLLTAHTNTAVDTMLARTLDAGVHDVLRVGHPLSGSRELHTALKALGRDPEDHFSASLARRAPSLQRLARDVRRAPVVAATTHACVRNVLFDVLERGVDVHGAPHGTTPLFDVVIVDEASQLTEPMAVGALLRAHRFVLVGDDCQLPPVVSAPDALTPTVAPELEPEALAAGLGGLDRSLFERLRAVLPGVMLREQYRMSDAVQAVPSRLFYADRLRAGGRNAERRLPLAPNVLADLPDELRRRVDPGRPVVWVDPGGTCDGNQNPLEAEAVAATAAALVALHRRSGALELPDDWLGIVAPFRAQCQAIRAALRDRLDPADVHRVEVDTVERFQGREKEAMLISLVTRDWNDFVFDRRRMNVTLTRARSKVVVFGNRALGRRMVETWNP